MKTHIRPAVTNYPYDIRVIEIDPGYAKQLLEMNTDNYRKLDKSRVAHYANEIRKGRWALNGESIKIKDGKVADGQHRLWAVIQANMPIMTVISFDLPGSVLSMDGGKTRTIGSRLAYQGVKNSNHVAAATKLVLQYDKGKWDINQLSQEDYADSDIVDYALKYKDHMENATRFGSRHSGIARLSVSLIAAISHITSGKSVDPEGDEFVRWFWESFLTGAGVDADEPVLLLRNRLIKANARPQDSLTSLYQRALVTLAWNKTIRGEKAKELRLRLTGPGKQALPKKLLMTTDYE